MRKLILSAAAVAISIAFIEFSEMGSVSASVDGDKAGQQVSGGNDAELERLISRLAARSTKGLTRVKRPDGSETVDLQGRFQNVLLGKMGSDGEPEAACVTGVDEASNFLGRDLRTGRPIASIDFLREPIAGIAARHGMSEQEYLFYSRLASAAVVRDAMLAPGNAGMAIINGDGGGEGFNDPAPAFVVGEGGNFGATLGQQRLNVFNAAASVWATFLDSAALTSIRSQFDPLTPCTPSGGVLGSAGTYNIHANFAGAEHTNTWYHAALANKQSGFDLVPANQEMNATFNSDVDNECLGTGTRFYYGLDNATPPGRINLLVVVLHEIGHGVGFQSFVDGPTGSMFFGYPDVYLRNMYDRSVGLNWAAMTDAQRAASALNTNNVLWDGPSVRLASGALTSGREASTGRVELFTPNPFQGGSSISHFSTAASPNLLMEPSINVGLPLDLDLTRQVMRDIGWYRDTTNDTVADTVTNVQPNSGVQIVGLQANITWTNTGGFNRNVAIDISRDGGATYTTIAASVANTGSYNWTVTGPSTSQARIRVREATFAAPAGVSSGNFIISLAPSSAPISVAGRVHSGGYGVRGAIVTLVSDTGESYSARTTTFGYFVIEGVPSGRNYVASVSAKGLSFEPRTITASEDIFGFDFEALN